MRSLHQRISLIFIVIVNQISSTYAFKEHAAVLILARGGSRGVPLKNLKRVGGVSLLNRSLSTARLAGHKDLTVSTDHPLIALEALKNGAEVFHRSSVTASDVAPSLWGVAEFLSFRKDVDVVVLLQATSPFTRASDLKTAVELLLRPPVYDCVFSVTRTYKLRWRNTAGQFEAINFKPEARPRRQDWAGELTETGAFYITRKNIVQLGYLQNHNCSVLEVPAKYSVEVDSFEDLSLANLMFSAGFYNHDANYN